MATARTVLPRRLWLRVRGGGPWQLWELPGWLSAYVVTIIILDAIAIVLASWASIPHVHLTQLLLFGALLGGAALTVEMTRSRGETAGVIKDIYAIWELPAVILLPPAFALLVPIPRIALTQWRIRQIAPHRRVFTAAVISLSYGGAYAAFHLVDRHLAGLSATPANLGKPAMLGWIVAILIAGLVGLALNNLLLVPAIKGSDPTVRIRDVIGTREGLVNDAVELCAAVLVTVAVACSVFALVLVLPLVVVLQRSSLHSQLLSDSRLDAKTGLLNAGTWRKEASAEVARASRTRAPVAVALIDLDYLKEINDVHGHLAGDNALAMVAEVLRTTLRDYDIAGRFGGDEFAVLLAQTDAVQALAITQRLRDQVSSTVVESGAAPDGPQVHCTASIGLAALPGDAASLTEILALADSALYRAKNAGRDRVAVMTEDGRLAASLVD
jgi:diguanylate cyclase (GGDEF)-like protein